MVCCPFAGDMSWLEGLMESTDWEAVREKRLA